MVACRGLWSPALVGDSVTNFSLLIIATRFPRKWRLGEMSTTSYRRGSASGAADCTRRRGCEEEKTAVTSLSVRLKMLDSPKSALQWYWSGREGAAATPRAREEDAMSQDEHDAAELVLEQLDAQWFRNNVVRWPSSSCPNSPVVKEIEPSSRADAPSSQSDTLLKRSRRLSDGDHHLRRYLDRDATRRFSDISNMTSLPQTLDQSSADHGFSHLTRVTEDEEMENDLLAKMLANRPAKLTTINPGRSPLQENRFSRNSNTPKPRRRLKGTKSLTDLEYEELRGFKDLGFEVSAGDLTPHVVRMFPGLQRQGIPPYNSPLGERNAVLPQHVLWPRRPDSPRVDMKGQLKSWASEMASIVSIEC